MVKGQAIFRVPVCTTPMTVRAAEPKDMVLKRCRFCFNGITPEEAEKMVEELF